MLRLGLLLCVSLPLAISTCAYNDCTACLVGGCFWCADSLSCIAPTETDTCDCLRKDIQSCPPLHYQCGDFFTCSDCASTTACAWCSSSKQCLDINYKGGGGYSWCAGSGICPGCQRSAPSDCSGIENTYCSNYTTCLSCTSTTTCSWCSSSGQCMDIDYKGGGGYNWCNPGTCDSCRRDEPGQCPVESAVCSDFPTCTSCASNPACAWCSSSHSCMDIDGKGGGQKNWCSPNFCKGCMLYDATTCPAEGKTCLDFKTCTDCASSPTCAWCTSSQTCLPINYKGGGGYSWCAPESCVGCMRSSVDQCGGINTTECSSYTDCRSCAGTQTCGWCPDSQSCSELDYKGGGGYNVCKPDTCDGCLRVARDQCPEEGLVCGSFKTCVDCTTNPACGWCTSTNKCQDLTYKGGGGYNWCPGESCAGCMRSSPDQCGAMDNLCSSIATCGDCVTTTTCAWCSSTNQCMDINYKGGGGYTWCAPNQCPGCMRSNLGQCAAAVGSSTCSQLQGLTACVAAPVCGFCNKTGICADVYGHGGSCGWCPDILCGTESPICSD